MKQAAPSQKRILVADDDPSILSLLKDTLGVNGYDVILARDGDEAWQSILRDVPDAVILDVDMPYLSGFQVCRNLRAEPRTRHMGVLFVTGHADVAERVLGFEVGGDDYIVKPFLPRELTARLSAVLRRSSNAGIAAETEEDSPPGEIIGVMGAKGGVGTSTIAANLAIALAMEKNTVCLADLDLEHAIGAMLLDLIPGRRGTIADLAKDYGTSVDWNIMQTVLVAHKSGVRVLPGPVNPTHAELVSGSQIKVYLESIRRHHSHSVLDLPSSFRDTNLDAFELCDRLLIVVTPDLPALKNLNGVSAVLQQLVPGRRLEVVINHTSPALRLSQNDIKDAAKLPVVANIPFGGEQLSEAANFGTPVIQKFPQNPVSVAIKKLALSLAQAKKDNKYSPRRWA